MFRIGLGYDIHKIDHKKRGIVLGGIKIDTPFSLIGHSDADVLLHSITDALLGALSLGDIGIHFSDDQQENKNKNSIEILKYANDLVKQKNYVIVNIDTNIICEKPKIQPIKNEIQQNITEVLKIDLDQISIKAKTNEGMDSIGSHKAIAAQAIVLLKKR